MRVVSFADLYAGKIVAAFDCQHPRDFLTSVTFWPKKGIDEALRRDVLVYGASPNHSMLCCCLS